MNRFLLAAVTSTALLVPTANALAAPGELDTSFSGDGLTSVDFGFREFGEGTAIQPDGKIVVLAQRDLTDETDYQVVRFHPDGSPDASFAGDGRAEIRFGSDTFSNRSHPTAVAVQPDGKIIVVGDTDANARPGNVHDMAIARLDAEGGLDKSFNGTGKQTIDYGQQDEAIDVAVQPDGKIVVGGTAVIGSDADFAVARLTTDGKLDSSWDGDGRTSTHFSGAEDLNGMTIAPNGEVVAVGQFQFVGGSTDTAIARYTTAGRPQTAFSGDGEHVVSFGTKDAGVDVAAQPGGKLVMAVASLSGVERDTIVARITPEGDPDPTFGDAGKTTAAMSANNTPAALALTDSGHIVVTGGVTSGPDASDLVAVELDSDGRPAQTFGGDGVAQFDHGVDFGRDIAVTGDRGLIVGSDSVGDVAVAAVTVDALPKPQDQPVPEGSAPLPQAPPETAPAAPQAPAADALAPVVSKLKLKTVRGTEKGAFRLSEKATVKVTLQRKVKRGTRTRLVIARTIKLKGKAGANAFKARKLKPGSYRVTLRATDAAGNKSKALRKSFVLRTRSGQGGAR